MSYKAPQKSQQPGKTTKKTLQIYKASAPGSLMLMGEHAVLQHKMALVCAINKRIRVTLVPRHDRCINMSSPLLGKFTLSLDDLPNTNITPPFTFVIASILFTHTQHKLPCGCDLLITTDFSEQLGFGSSAAVTVATLAVLQQWLQGHVQRPRALLISAREVIRRVQGFGSAADAAASIMGGVITYRTQPLQMKKIASFIPLTVVYSGIKVPTRTVVQHIAYQRKKYPRIFTALDATIERCVKEAVIAIKQQNWQKLGEITNIHQGLHDAMGVNTAILSSIVFALRNASSINNNDNNDNSRNNNNRSDSNSDENHDVDVIVRTNNTGTNNSMGMYGAKISGSGMGDCVVGIGTLNTQETQRVQNAIQNAAIKNTCGKYKSDIPKLRQIRNMQNAKNIQADISNTLCVKNKCSSTNVSTCPSMHANARMRAQCTDFKRIKILEAQVSDDGLCIAE